MEDDCEDKIKFSLSDRGGELRFTEFNIAGDSSCAVMEDRMREYVMARPLAEIDVEFIRSLDCSGGNRCGLAIAKVIEDHQSLFCE